MINSSEFSAAVRHCVARAHARPAGVPVSVRDVMRAELERACFAAEAALLEERGKLKGLREPAHRAAQLLRIAAAAAEHQRLLAALFASEPSNCRR